MRTLSGRIVDRPRSIVAVCCTLAVLAMLVVLPVQPADALAKDVPNPWTAEGLEVVGEVPNPWQEDWWGEINFVDAEARLGYGQMLGNRLGVYDLATSVPTPVRISESMVSSAGAWSSYTMTIDRARNRMLIVGRSPSADNRSLVDLIDLETLTHTGTWDLAATLPGYVARGFTYEEATDRVLLVGDFTATVGVGGALSSFGYKVVGPGSAVVALDAATGSVQWVAPMRQCHSVLNSSSMGALIARSIHRPALYVFCVYGRAAQQPTGQNALLRLDITEEKDASGVVEFPSEVFPVSGDYAGTPASTGQVGFDPVGERLFAQSLSERTPGAWVFDGLRDSWVGFIAAPDGKNHYFGINPANGRHYQAGGGEFNQNSGYINVSDGRATPVPQGTLLEGMYFNGPIAIDPVTGRLFVRVNVPTDETQPRITTLVLRDTTDSIVPLPQLNYDDLTKNLPDDQALLQYSAGSSGFGARYTAVGGWESVYDRIRNPISPAAPNPAGSNPADLSNGDRGVTFSAVPSVDIRPAGASATAAAGALDAATQSDRSDLERDAGGAPEAPVSLLGDGLTCLDGGGERIDRRQGNGDPGRVHVECDLDRFSATGSASFSDNVNGGGQSLAASSFDTRTFRDPKRGVVTESTAVAEGISLEEPDGRGGVTIDRVTAVATTVANGRPRTSKATWRRIIDGVVVTDRDGTAQEPLSCTTTVVAGKPPEESGRCRALQQAVNQISPSLSVRFPLPAVTATPRGAFARVEERETDYFNSLTLNNDQSRAVPAMEFTIFNDGPEKGRLLVQLAAIDANSIFTRSRIPTFPDFNRAGPPPEPADTGSSGGSTTTSHTGGGSVEVARSTSVPSGDGGGALDSSTDVAFDAGVESVAAMSPDEGVLGDLPEPVRSIVGWLVGRRSARDAAMSGGVWLLFFAALYGVWRRRRLIETVGG